MPPRRARERCKGRIDGGTGDRTINKGHDTVTFGSNGDHFLVCKKCGGVSSRNSNGKMSKECEPPTSWGKQVLKQVFNKGRHPSTRLPIDHTDDQVEIKSRHENTTSKITKRLAKEGAGWRAERISCRQSDKDNPDEKAATKDSSASSSTTQRIDEFDRLADDERNFEAENLASRAAEEAEFFGIGFTDTAEEYVVPKQDWQSEEPKGDREAPYSAVAIDQALRDEILDRKQKAIAKKKAKSGQPKLVESIAGEVRDEINVRRLKAINKKRKRDKEKRKEEASDSSEDEKDAIASRLLKVAEEKVAKRSRKESKPEGMGLTTSFESSKVVTETAVPDEVKADVEDKVSSCNDGVDESDWYEVQYQVRLFEEQEERGRMERQREFDKEFGTDVPVVVNQPEAKESSEAEDLLSYAADLDLIQDLLDLHRHGESVRWPTGLDPQSAARLIKAKEQEAKRLNEATSYAAHLETFVIDSDDDAVVLLT
jgi:hypothetical protein